MPSLRLFAVGFLVIGVVGSIVWWTKGSSPDAVLPGPGKPTVLVGAQSERPQAPVTTAEPAPASVPGTALVVSQATPTEPVAALPPAVSPPPLESAPPAPTGPTAKILADAHRTGQDAEATSPLLAPAPFDEKAFSQDPAPYLQRSVPGRVFQTAQPGPSVPVLGARGPATHEIAHGGACELAVRAPAGAPVTFTTFDLGLFDNGLASITVQANAEGVATARFSAVGEVAGDIHLLAGSPMASGQVKFLVGVLPPPDRISQTN